MLTKFASISSNRTLAQRHLSKTDRLASPYFITDLSFIDEQLKKFKQHLPQVGIYYAIKANDSPEIIRHVNESVDGFDIASLGEAIKLQKIGVKPERLMYSNPVKINEHIEKTYEMGVRKYAFDSTVEVEKLARLAPGSEVYLRLKVSDHGSKFPLSSKFGVDIGHAVDYCLFAEEAGLKPRGLTFHVGSQSENVQAWETAIEIAGRAIKKLAEKDIHIEFLDLGGGFPAEYGEPAPGIKQVAASIKAAVLEHIPTGTRLLAEPGRYIVANSTTLVSTVIGREHRSGTDWLYLDVGTFQGLMEPLEMPNMRYPVRTDKSPKGYKRSFVLTGPTCDAYDTIGTDYSLPSDISVGDRVYFEATGAYTNVYNTSFNGFPSPKQYFIKGEK